MERAMILSGGGARGAFQVGVWRYLSEIGWRPELVCGSSVGASPEENSGESQEANPADEGAGGESTEDSTGNEEAASEQPTGSESSPDEE